MGRQYTDTPHYPPSLSVYLAKVETFLCNVPLQFLLIKGGISYSTVNLGLPVLLDLVSGLLEEWFSHRDMQTNVPCHLLLLLGALQYMFTEVRIVLTSLSKSVFTGKWHKRDIWKYSIPLFGWSLHKWVHMEINHWMEVLSIYFYAYCLYSTYTSVGTHTYVCVRVHTWTKGMVHEL